MEKGKLTSLESLQADVPASIVVFLVAVPLCMGIAIASGAPPAAGLLTGIIGGLVVGWIAGSPLQVSGPAAGLATFVNLPKSATALEQVEPGTKVHVRFSDLRYIDHSCLNLLRSWKTLHEQQGGRVITNWQGLEARCFEPSSWKRGPSPVEKIG